MAWGDAARERIDVALNEADVLGLRPAPGGIDVLLHVLALPVSGPIDPDRRRFLRLHRASTIEVVLRPDSPSAAISRPAIPLADLDAVEAFFASLSWGGSIYGWHFLDDPSLTADWPTPPSLHVDLRSEPAEHTFYSFNECGHDDGTDIARYCIEGTVTFDDLTIHTLNQPELHPPKGHNPTSHPRRTTDPAARQLNAGTSRSSATRLHPPTTTSPPASSRPKPSLMAPDTPCDSVIEATQRPAHPACRVGGRADSWPTPGTEPSWSSRLPACGPAITALPPHPTAPITAAGTRSPSATPSRAG